MSGITATLAAIPNGTVIDLDAEGTLNWFRPGGSQYSHWLGNYLIAGPETSVDEIRRNGLYYPDQPFAQWVDLDRTNRNSTAPSHQGACRSFDRGRLPVGLAPRCRVSMPGGVTFGSDQVTGVEASGLLGHAFLNARRLYWFDPGPNPDNNSFSLNEAASSAYTVSAPQTAPDNGRAQINVGLPGRSSAFVADYYFWYRSGVNLSWSLESLGGATTGVLYNAATHGPMVTAQAYRLRAAFPASVDPAVERFALRYWSEFESGTSTPAKVAFSCITMRTGAQ